MLCYSWENGQFVRTVVMKYMLDYDLSVYNCCCRYKGYVTIKEKIHKSEGGLETFSRGYERFGVLKTPEGISYREWAPGAKEVFLTGDFSM